MAVTGSDRPLKISKVSLDPETRRDLTWKEIIMKIYQIFVDLVREHLIEYLKGSRTKKICDILSFIVVFVIPVFFLICLRISWKPIGLHLIPGRSPFSQCFVLSAIVLIIDIIPFIAGAVYITIRFLPAHRQFFSKYPQLALRKHPNRVFILRVVIFTIGYLYYKSFSY